MKGNKNANINHPGPRINSEIISVSFDPLSQAVMPTGKWKDKEQQQ